jgi:hypothetical protein
MTKRAMGENPLDALLTGKKKNAPAPPPAEEPGSTKAKTSFNLPEDVVELARDAAWWARLSLAELAEEALRREVARLAKREGHTGGVFPKRKAPLKAGRPTT